MDVTFVLTHDCNLGCGYCYAGAKFNKRMPMPIAERALDLAFEDAPSRVELSFFGGEPLLAYDLLCDIARQARERARRLGTEARMSVTTNGTLLDDERAKVLDDLGVHVALSIDGTKEAHDSGRPRMGGGSSFDEVLRGLDVLLRRGTTFETISVVTPQNVRLLGESVAFLLDRGVPRVGLNPCYEAAFTDDDLSAWHRGLESAAAHMVDCFRAGRIVSVTVFDNKILAALKGGLAETDRCSLGSRSVAVAPSGNIYPCERLVAEDEDTTRAMGHVETGLVVRGEGCARGPVNDECDPCGEKDRCSSSCACANLAETGRTDVAGGTQCWHERTTASVADQIAATLWKEQNPYFLAWFYGRMLGHAAKPAAPETAPDPERNRAPAGVVARETPKSKHHLRIVS